MDVENVLQDAPKKLAQFGTLGAGVAGGVLLMKKVPGPWYAPGLAGILAALGIIAFSKNDYLDFLGYGLGTAGFIDLGKKAGDNIPMLSFLSDQLPTLAGATLPANYVLPQTSLLSGSEDTPTTYMLMS